MQRYIRRHVSGPIQHRHGVKFCEEQCTYTKHSNPRCDILQEEWSSPLVPEKRIWDMTHWKNPKITTSMHVKVRMMHSVLYFYFWYLKRLHYQMPWVESWQGPQIRNSILVYPSNGDDCCLRDRGNPLLRSKWAVEVHLMDLLIVSNKQVSSNARIEK